MSNATPNRGLPSPAGGDAVNVYPALGQSLAAALDNDMAMLKGPSGARPAAGAVPNATAWYSTDNHTLSVSDGTAWHVYNSAESGAPAWPVGGDLSGTLPNPTVNTVNGGHLAVTSALGGTTLSDPAMIYGTGNIGYGPGTGYPFQGLPLGNYYDPGSRFFGGTYIARNNGLYLTYASVGFNTTYSATLGLAIQNSTNPSSFEVDVLATRFAGNITAASAHITTVIFAFAGDALDVALNVNASGTLTATGVLGKACNWFGAVQIK